MQARPDRIAAVATAHGRGGIGIVRVSGHNLSEFAHALVGKAVSARQATYASFFDADGKVIDQGIALFFPGPHSYTGEDVLELQGHGGTVLPQLVLQRCLELGARLAQPGEFTQRAFLNNKLDLAQAESVADLIDATTTQAARSAMRSLQGEFSEAINGLVERLIRLRMLVEAMLDFPEEEIGSAASFGLEAQYSEIGAELERILGLAKQGSILREGAHVVLAGEPNVGKSSLLNRLCGEELALVSEIPGTTRDVIRQAIQLNGVPLHIIDTAGLREASDRIEQMGIARTHGALEKADAVLVVSDASSGATQREEILTKMPQGVALLQVFNKIDLTGELARIEEGTQGARVYVSARTGAGMDLLRDKLLGLVGWHQEAGVFMARERHLRALGSARGYLSNAAGVIRELDLFAEELRLAQEELGAITGEFTPDDLLGEIFSKFCIGK